MKTEEGYWDGVSKIDFSKELPDLTKEQKYQLVDSITDEEIEKFVSRKIKNLNERNFLRLLDCRVKETIKVEDYPVLNMLTWTGSPDYVTEEYALTTYQNYLNGLEDSEHWTQKEQELLDYLVEKLSYGYFLPYY